MNAMKHGEPAHIWITLLETGDGVDLTVRDDGAGFDTSLGPTDGHFGTIMMRERALVAGGSFKIESTGCSVLQAPSLPTFAFWPQLIPI